MTAMLELDGVSKAFGGILANDRVSLRVEQGAIVGLIGPNGSGKTTLFNAITGALPIDSGSIRFKGREISKLLAGEVARAGIIRTFQQPRIYRNMSVAANMLVSAAIRRASFADLFRRESGRPNGNSPSCSTLSASQASGRRRRRSLLRATETTRTRHGAGQRSDLLLLDEPTAGINPILIASLIDRLKAANRERGLTLLVIEHNMPVIMDLAEHIYCLAHGRLLAEGRRTRSRATPKCSTPISGA